MKLGPLVPQSFYERDALEVAPELLGLLIRRDEVVPAGLRERGQQGLGVAADARPRAEQRRAVEADAHQGSSRECFAAISCQRSAKAVSL